jgi:hypothetical protein
MEANRDQTSSQVQKRGEGKSLSQILNEPEPEERYLLKPMFERGDKGFVVSSYKTGKTLFLMHLTLCLSSGIPFLGFEVPSPVKVLYVRFELKDFKFRKRLNLMVNGLGGLDKVEVEPIFELVRGFNITNEKDFGWLLNLIEKHKAEVLLLDPLYKIAPIDLKDTANAMPLIRRYDSIIEAYPDLSIITAHHMRKQRGDEKDSWDSTYGPMFFFADMDFEIRIKHDHKKHPNFIFEHISNDVSIDSFPFKRDPETLLYYVSNPSDDHSKEITDYVGENKPTKGILIKWMQATFGYSRRQGRKVIDEMMKSSQLSYEGKKTRGHLIVPKEHRL